MLQLLLRRNEYKTHFWGMCKNEPVMRMRNIDVRKKTKQF